LKTEFDKDEFYVIFIYWSVKIRRCGGKQLQWEIFEHEFPESPSWCQGWWIPRNSWPWIPDVKNTIYAKR